MGVQMFISGVGPRRSSMWLAIFSAVLALVFLCLIPQSASAQTVTNYTDTPSTAVTITDNACAAASSVVRTFNVPTSYTVSDVNLGVLITHTYRRDLRITLTHGSTTVSLIDFLGGAADNLNVTFDDEATGGTIASHTTNDPLTPIYNSTKIPAAALTAFDGQNASGAWTLTICDQTAVDVGTYTQATLSIRSAPTSYADLSLAKTVSNASPTSGGTTDYTLTVTNAATSTLAAGGVTVTDTLPLGTTFNAVVSGTGTYNSGTGIWTVGAVPIGSSINIVIRVNVTASAGTTVTNIADITTSSVTDLDSTPGNGLSGEDDYATRSFTATTRVAGTPPTLTCPAGTLLHDWNTAAATVNVGGAGNNYAVTGIGNMNVTLTATAGFVAGSPIVNTTLTGGLAATETSLFENLDNNTQSDESITTITLPTAVAGMQFRLFDIDFGAASFADKLTITATFNGSPVTPTLTNGIANYVLGNVVIGDQPAASNVADGNVVVTFTSPVDTVTIRYGNHITAPTNPGNQFMSIHDITFCRPVATLNVTKISNILSDGISVTNPKAIPGAIVRYCILVSNAGSGTTTNISVSDPIPANVTYIAGSMISGTACNNAATTEDDDATGADESDPFGMSVTGATLTATATTLAPSASMALVFNATLN